MNCEYPSHLMIICALGLIDYSLLGLLARLLLWAHEHLISVALNLRIPIIYNIKWPSPITGTWALLNVWLIRIEKWVEVRFYNLSYCHSCIQWATRKRPHETWGSKHVFWRSYEGFNTSLYRWSGLDFLEQLSPVILSQVTICGCFMFVSFFFCNSLLFDLNNWNCRTLF